MRLVGRHLTPLLPFLLAAMACGLARLLEKPTIWKRADRVCERSPSFFFPPLKSGSRPVFGAMIIDPPRPLRVNALDAGQNVWWLADVSTGRYYHVPFGSPQLTVAPDLSGSNATPDLVIFSKPDIYDSSGAVRRYLTENGFTVHASSAGI